MLVHRIAYLIRVRREKPRGFLALAYNRHAAVEIRRRLAELIGDDARSVMVLTCHALAMPRSGLGDAAWSARKGRRPPRRRFHPASASPHGGEGVVF